MQIYQSVIKLALTSLLTFTFSAQCHEALLSSSAKRREPLQSCAAVMRETRVYERKKVFPHDPTRDKTMDFLSFPSHLR